MYIISLKIRIHVVPLIKTIAKVMNGKLSKVTNQQNLMCQIVI